MEGLKLIARYDLSKNYAKFQRSSTLLDVVDVSATIPDEPSFSTYSVSEDGLLSQLKGNIYPVTRSEGQHASLQLVHIPRKDGHKICISESVFFELLSHFKISHNITYMLDYHPYGLQNVSSNSEGMHVFYYEIVSYTLIWSFDPARMATRAIFLPRENSPFGRSETIFQGLRNLLKHYRHHLFNPDLLIYLACIHIIGLIHGGSAKQYNSIRQIERETGHGARHLSSWAIRGQGPQLPTEELIKHSAQVSASLVDLARDTRHLDIAASLLSSVSLRTDWQGLVPESLHDHCISSLDECQRDTTILREQIESGRQSIDFLKERLTGQSRVLFALLTHVDSINSQKIADESRKMTELARSDNVEMKKLAESTRRDSSAMKTIAMMTMLFLPATFFAALFAVPSLDWDQPTVIKPKFWIYWAFTIPATIFIFLAWLIMTHWNEVQDVLSRMRRKSKAAEVKA